MPRPMLSLMGNHRQQPCHEIVQQSSLGSGGCYCACCMPTTAPERSERQELTERQMRGRGVPCPFEVGVAALRIIIDPGKGF